MHKFVTMFDKPQVILRVALVIVVENVYTFNTFVKGTWCSIDEKHVFMWFVEVQAFSL